ncbi:hypothetical protein JYU34_014910 [Plutella xylostella]|uniref:Borealin C-terminal domain-containing protein n=1 Tax=Plutella xylostella TaxID=51655 RepID=A0ABQ7Q5U7_PLUXY|nr:hypothetical protein JYU34_014910 [Plutella xylostella]
MPRTKRPVSKKEKSIEEDDALKKLDRLAQEKKNKIKLLAQMQCRDIELAFKILMGSLSPDILQKTIGELKSELLLKEVSATNRRTRHSSRAASHDDGYLTENSSQGSGGRGKRTMLAPPTAGKKTVRRSRSASTARPPATACKTTQRRRSKSVYRTPAYNKNAAVNYPPITPKVAPHTPLMLLRQPRQGEMVVSMSGSPVMMPTCNNIPSEEKAHCNIMLQDGTMLSLQPKELRQSQAYIPFALMDANVLKQLNTLKNNLDKVVKMGKKEGFNIE